MGIATEYKTYHIVRDFTDNYLLREIGFGDKQWPFHVSKNLLDINTLLISLESRVETKATTTTTTTTTSTTTTTTGP